MRQLSSIPSTLALLVASTGACTDSELGGQADRDAFNTTEPDTTLDFEDTGEVHVTPACSTDEACVAFFASQLSPCEIAFCDSSAHRCDTRRRDNCCESELDCLNLQGEAPRVPVGDPACQVFTCPIPGGTCQTTDICSGCSLDSECQQSAPLCSRGRCNEGQCTFEPVPTCCIDASDCDDADACTDAQCDQGVCHYRPNGHEGCCANIPVLDTSFSPAPFFDARSTVTDVRWSPIETTFTPTPPAALYLGNPDQLQLVSNEGSIRADIAFTLGLVDPGSNIEVKFQTYLDIRAALDVDRFRVFLRSAEGDERLVFTKANAALSLWQPIKRVFFVTNPGPWELVAEFDGVTPEDAAHFGIILDDLQVRTNCSIQTCSGNDECASQDPCVRGFCNGGTCGYMPDPNCNPECVSDMDCMDASVCTEDRCNGGHCAHKPYPNCCQSSDICDDGNPCTSDHCDQASGACRYDTSGLCVGCNPPDCNDFDPCTRDVCDVDRCSHTFDPSLAPFCGGCDPMRCNDGDPCTRDTCSTGPDGTVMCVSAFDPTLFGCQAKECQTNQDCHDGTPCTTNVCDASGRCSFTPVPGCCQTDQNCVDNDPCTLEKCEPGTGLCYYYQDPMCSVCDATQCFDNDPCTRDICEGPFCAHVFDPTLAGCGQPPECQSNQDCRDGTPCTQDTCDSAGRCTHTPVPGCCQSEADCADNNPCTYEKCDPAAGLCYYFQDPMCTVCDPARCVDNDPCTRDTCQGPICVHGFDPTLPGCGTPGCHSVSDCNDNDNCSEDSCLADGTCFHQRIPGCSATCTAASCDDGNFCTRDTCLTTGNCVHEFDPTIPGCAGCDATMCNDGNACTKDGCTADGRCINEPIPGCTPACANGCNDNNPCTTDTCSASGACIFSPLPNRTSCNDGDACTVNDVCIAGACTSGGALSCDDGNVCTGDRCNPLTGCEHERLPIPGCGPICTSCDDGNPCTTDTCDNASGACTHAAVAGCCTSGGQCADGDLCTSDTCEQNTCKHTRLDIPLCQAAACQTANDCAGGSACTTASCVDGQCRLQPLVGCCQSSNDCDDKNACTNDFCIAQVGICFNTNVGCDDNDPCTIDACDPSQGCVHKPDPQACACEEQKLWVRTFEAGETPDVTIEGGGGQGGGVRWRVDAVRSHSPSNALRFGDSNGENYDTNGRVSGRATGPTVAVPAEASNATLEFWTYVDVDSDPASDVFRVRLLTGDGQNVILWERTSLAADQYRQWVPISIALPAEALGQDVQVRFVFDSVDGQGNNGQGVFVDDIVLHTTCP